MEIMKVKNYKTFADFLTKRTGCDVLIKIVGADHYHYQINKRGLSIGVLCIDKGVSSFAPFETLDSAKNDQYINIQFAPMFEDLTELFKVFGEIFVDNNVET